MQRGNNAILFIGAAVFIGWVIGHFGELTGDEGGLIRVVLGLVLALPVIFRWKRRDGNPKRLWPSCTAALCGVALVGVGLVFDVNQFEWLGLVLLLYASLRYALPGSYSRDVALGVFLIYWIHPLPGQVFGRLELAMQWASVNGAEWALHCANVRSWADGFILRTGTRVFEVPRACSGMRTAVTVLMTTLGVGMLLRLKWYEIVPFLVLGLVQVLVLNIVRIVFMVFWSARMPFEWAESFLHDSLGWFLLVAILLTQVEASWWKVWRARRRRMKEAIESGEAEPPDLATFLPRFWHLFQKWAWLVLLVLLAAAGAAGAVYKRRPEHRSIMVGGIVEELMQNGALEAAERAAMAAIELSPAPPRHYFSLRARILAGRGKFAEAVAAFDRLPGVLSTLEVVHKAGALTKLGRVDDAVSLINGLAPGQQRIPGVAIIKAEYGVQRDKPEVVKKNIALAAQHQSLMPRVRALFPYLARCNMWRTIVDSDRFDTDYEQFASGLIAVHAHLKLNDIGGCADALDRVMRTWPQDHRLLSAVFEMAVKRPAGDWEERFAANLRSNVVRLDADRLATYVNYCFRLRRPDLAWLVLVRLAKIDADDPAISLAAARFGPVWYTARKHRLGLPARNIGESVNLRYFSLLTADVEPMRSLWKLVPMADTMVDGVDAEEHRGYTRECLRQFEIRRKESRLTKRMEAMYPAVLAMAGKNEEAHAVLERIGERWPDRKADVLLQRALLYDTRGRTDEAYEFARKCLTVSDAPSQATYLLMVNALVRRNMGAYALEVLRRARKSFPDAIEMDVAEAAVWDMFGAKDRALFILGRRNAGAESATTVRLLYETGRIREARRLGAALGLRRIPDRDLGRQALTLPPAELSVTRSWGPPVTAGEMAEAAKGARARLAESRSPFFRAVFRLEADWYAAAGKGMVWDPDKWRTVGRDDMERASALHRLVSLLARQGEYGRAFEATKLAIELAPDSVALWRYAVALKEGDSETVARARARCPDDPEIWLAWMISAVRRGKSAALVEDEMRLAVDTGRFSAETIVRASDFLLRNGMPDAAEHGARYAVKNGRGLVPAYTLGIMCAARVNDAKWAQICSIDGADHALDPQPFFETLVLVKSAAGVPDGDLVRALEYLQGRAKKDTKWVQTLGGVYFDKGETGRALSLLGPLIDKDAGSVRVNSLLLAAEAARAEGLRAKAVEILELAHKTYPRRADVLNNLVYNLAIDPKTTGRALKLLPSLLELDNRSAAVMDTAAVVYSRAGRVPLAWRYMEKALDRVADDDYSAMEIGLNAAELQYRMGDYKDALRRLEAVLRRQNRSGVVDRRAKDLLGKVKAKLEKSTGGRDH